MTTHNPYTPPASSIDVNHKKTGQKVFVALVVLHLLVSMIFASSYIELVRVGAARPIGLVLLGPACIGLYLGTIFLVLRSKGKSLFICSAIGLALAGPVWWPSVISYAIFFGSLLAIWGWWFSRDASKVLGEDHQSAIEIEP